MRAIERSVSPRLRDQLDLDVFTQGLGGTLQGQQRNGSIIGIE